MAKYCFKCGNQLNDNDTFCSACGQNQSKNEKVSKNSNIDTSSDGLILTLLIISDILLFISLFMINEDGLHNFVFYPALILGSIGLIIAKKKGYKSPIKDFKGANKAFSIIGIILTILFCIIYIITGLGSI